MRYLPSSTTFNADNLEVSITLNGETVTWNPTPAVNTTLNGNLLGTIRVSYFLYRSTVFIYIIVTMFTSNVACGTMLHALLNSYVANTMHFVPEIPVFRVKVVFISGITRNVHNSRQNKTVLKVCGWHHLDL